MESLLHDPDIVQDFVTEATERLDRIADWALEAEQGGHEALKELRRELHTLKGAAGFLGFDRFSELCHVLEEFLLKVAGDTGSADSFDAVHDACDLLREWVELVEACCHSGRDLPEDTRSEGVRARLAG